MIPFVYCKVDHRFVLIYFVKVIEVGVGIRGLFVSISVGLDSRKVEGRGEEGR